MTTYTDRIVLLFAIPAHHDKPARPAAASLQMLEVSDSGREFENLTPLDVAALGDYSDQFSLPLIAERDALQSQVTALTAERDTLQTQVDTIPGLTAQIVELTAEKAELEAEVARLAALVPPPLPPRAIPPRDFLARISDDDKLEIMQSKDPRCMVAMMHLFTALSVELDSPVLHGMIDALVDAGIPIDDADRERLFA